MIFNPKWILGKKVASVAMNPFHSDTKTSANHLINASNFSDELRALVGLFPNGVQERTLQVLLNKYPDPRINHA